MSMVTEKITLMEAYLIEHLRNANISDEVIKNKVKNKEAASFAYVHDSFDFTLLDELRNNIDAIVDEGYEVRFLTFKGVYSLLELKFNKEQDVDFYIDEFTVTHLHLTAEEIRTLKQLVSANWEVTSTEDGVTIAPVHMM